MGLYPDAAYGSSPAYAARFADIEPFYNGQAFGRTHNGCHVLVGESGSVIREISRSVL